jgi:vancomycin resistance protein YoaR
MAGSDAKKSKNIRIILIWANVTVGVIAVVCLLVAGSMAAYSKMYEGKMLPGARVLGVRLDGMTPAESRTAVESAIDGALVNGLRFSFRDQEINLPATSAPTDPTISRDLIVYNVDAGIDRAYALGHTGGWLRRTSEALRLFAIPKDVGADATIDRETISAALRNAVEKDLTPPQDASFDVNLETNPPVVTVTPEREGQELAMDAAMDELERNADRLNFEPVELDERTIRPKIVSSSLMPLVADVSAMLNRPSLSFIFDGKTVSVPTSTLAEWVYATSTRSDVRIGLDPAAFTNSIYTLFPDLKIEQKKGSLVVKDGKIESFVPGVSGRELDAGKTLEAVQLGWPPTSTFTLFVRTIEGTLEGEDPERLGIKEIIGIGHSNIAGSPTNRRKNIKLGAERVNGTIIEPGKEFSMLTVLGSIDGAHGWLPELVIKGNETIPEYGGGLCQIGTTTFRGALDAGLKIVERRNHSYRVRYYEPAGTDATIYEPKPDFRFMNDTAYPVLINAYIKGDDVTFEFWGTDDGRKTMFEGQTTVDNVAALKPRVYNVTSPPPMKLIETLDLKPGQKKCTETAHAGADAEFKYTVTRANGESTTETFTSHYRPWQAVCLVGVEKLSEPATEAPPEEI